MKRRQLIAFVGGAVAAWSLAARAQPVGKMWRIAFIAHTPESYYEPLFEDLRELGYMEGQNIIIERRYAEGNPERFTEFAAEMVRLKADLIITITTPAALAAKNATTTIPIVIPTAIDPVATGLIAGLAHPGGNVTGGAILTGEMAAKRLQLLKGVVSNLSRTAVLWNSANPANALAWRETQGAARTLGLTLQSHEVQSPKDFEVTFATMVEERVDALFVLDDALTIPYRKKIADFALQNHLPTMFAAKDRSEAGGLMSYGPRYPEMMRRAASLVDKILRGAQPANLPMEQPSTFELVINLKTAKAIGLAIPPALLVRADEVIE
jgi:putative tryptophan/tyrosine transport system substrate-binding protein